jgi:hypothetical protein
MWTERRSTAVRPTSEPLSTLIGCSTKNFTNSAPALLEHATWYFPSCNLNKMEYSDAQSSAAVRTITSRTRWTSIGELEIIRRTSAVADCCSNASFSSRVSRATSPSLTAAEEVKRVASLRRFSFAALGLRALAGSRLTLERLFIGSPVGLVEGILDGQRSAPKVALFLLADYDANSSSSAFASFRSRVSNPSVNQP